MTTVTEIQAAMAIWRAKLATKATNPPRGVAFNAYVRALNTSHSVLIVPGTTPARLFVIHGEQKAREARAAEIASEGKP